MNNSCLTRLLNQAIEKLNAREKKVSTDTDWSNFNPHRVLTLIGNSGKVYINTYALKPVWATWQKDVPEGPDLFYIGNEPLFRLSGSIYWYCIGNVGFDIRQVRRLGGFPKDDYKADHDHQNPINALILIAKQWDTILQKVETHHDFLGQRGLFTKAVCRDLPF